jgi:hypothetical protein
VSSVAPLPVTESSDAGTGLVDSVSTGLLVPASVPDAEVESDDSSEDTSPLVCTVSWSAGLGRCLNDGSRPVPAVWPCAVESDWPAEVPVFDCDLVSEDSFGFVPDPPSPESAHATPWPVNTAVPIPRATANPPTRPTYLAALVMIPPLVA